MRREFTKHGLCNCAGPETWANDPEFPVKYDEKMNEYVLVYGKDNNKKAIMYYCFFCGGKLPESLRDTYFTEPSETEVKEMLAIARGIDSKEKMLAVLGDPDEEYSWTLDLEDFMALKHEIRKWTKQFSYSKKWKTLVLIFYLLEDGSLEYSYSGKYIPKAK